MSVCTEHNTRLGDTGKEHFADSRYESDTFRRDCGAIGASVETGMHVIIVLYHAMLQKHNSIAG